MTRPRHPALSALCALLLLALVAVCVSNYRVGWILTVGAGRFGVSALAARGAVAVNVVTTASFGSGFAGGDTFNGPAIAQAARLREKRVPMWALLPIPVAGLWWSWRGRKAEAGFPVEPAPGAPA